MLIKLINLNVSDWLESLELTTNLLAAWQFMQLTFFNQMWYEDDVLICMLTFNFLVLKLFLYEPLKLFSSSSSYLQFSASKSIQSEKDQLELDL